MLLAAVAGYWFVRNNTLRAAFAVCFLMQLAIVGAFLYWYGGFSFGMRFFINLTPFFAIGLAAVATRIRPVVARVAVAVLAAWNFVLILSFTYTIKGDVAPGYLGLVQIQLHSLTLLEHLIQGYVVRGIGNALLRRGGDLPGAIAVFMLEIVIIAFAVRLTARDDTAPQPARPA